jgi:tetratricopeptide (TPR) repeat protein
MILLWGAYASASEDASLQDNVTAITGQNYKGDVVSLTRATLTIQAGTGGRAVNLRIDNVVKIVLSANGRKRLLEVRDLGILVLGNGKIIEGEITEITDKHVKIIPKISGAEITFPVEEIKLILKARTPEQAYESRRALLDVRKKDHLGHLELGLWSLAYESLSIQVFDELNAAIKDKPDYTEAYLQLSDLYQEKYERDLADEPVTETEYNNELELYYRALEAGIEHPVLLHRLARVMQRRGQAESAIRTFEKAVEANDILQLGWVERECELEIGEIRLNSGETQKALKRFTNVTNKYPGHFRARYLAGLARLRLRHDDDAMIELECAAEIEPFYPDVHVALAAGYYLLGVPNEVDRRISDAHSLGPPTVQSLLLQAYALMEVAQLDNAGRAIAQAAELDPDNPDVVTARAYREECTGEVVSAIDTYGEAIDLLKASGAASEEIGFLHFQRAGVAISGNILNIARSEVEEALKAGFDPVRSFKLKGYIALRSGSYDEAERFLGYAYSLKRTPDLEYMLGVVAVETASLIEAKARFDATLVYDKNHSGAIYGLGYIAHRERDSSKAMQYFEQASKLAGPGAELAKEALTAYAEMAQLKEWIRDFSKRSDGKLPTEWQIDGYAGATVGVAGGAAVIECEQKDDGVTSFGFEHDATLAKFVLFEAVLEAPVSGEAVVGVEFRALDRYIRFARDIDGTLVYNYEDELGEPKSKEWISTGVRFVENSHRLGIKLVDLREGRFELLLDGRPIPLPVPVETTGFKSMKKFSSRVFGQAKKGVPWKAKTRYVRVVFRELGK